MAEPETTPPNTLEPGRDRFGRFLPGHRENLTTGQHTDRSPIGLEHLQADVDAFLTAALVDEADAGDLPVRRRSLIEYRARLHRRILQLDAALELRGVLDKRQKLRATWLSTLSSLIERCRQLDLTLGLERLQKPVQSLEDWLVSTRPETDQSTDAAEAGSAEPDAEPQT